MKVVFMGTPDFAKESLEFIYNNGYDIVGVVTNPDKPKGRGMKMIASPVKEFAVQKKLKVYQPQKIRQNIEFINEMKQLNPDVICVVAYGKILPKELLDIPKLGAINVHGSLLPKYRGAAPIQWAILNGDTQTGITTIYMDVGMDTGDIILDKVVKIDEDETTGELWERLSKIGANLLVETLKKVENGTAPRKKQGDNYTMAPMLTKEIAKINWDNSTAYEIKNLVRGLNPIMGAYCYINDKKIKFWKVKVIEYNDFTHMFDINDVEKIKPGRVIVSDQKHGLYIKCKDAIISVLEIQAENSRKMNIFEFLRGNPISKEETFN